MAGHDNPNFVGDELNLNHAEEKDEFKPTPPDLGKQKSRRKSNSSRSSGHKSLSGSIQSDDSNSNAVKSAKSQPHRKNSSSERASNYTPTYFPQARHSINDDKSVCTINVKSLPGLDNGQATGGDAITDPDIDPEKTGGENGQQDRDQWGKSIEFLMSCIAMSVGLGNVWRFPFTALENGGGAFLIPYLIVLVLVGRPIYYMEMVIGQFSSRGPIKVYDLSPAMRGVGYGQILCTGIVATYYSSVMAVVLEYFGASFAKELPWSKCDPKWGPNCYDSTSKNVSLVNRPLSAANLYYLKEVLKEKTQIHDGIGYPDLNLSISLGISWLIIMLLLIKGIRSSGKASYFLALFPYLIIGILLIRAVTLPGASIGLIYFFKPQWDRILDPSVWYAAVTQVFFSLSVCFGNIIMYSSYNKFRHNVYRDATIVATLDTFTSILSGATIFGILGNLAHEMGTDDVNDVVQSGPGIAFVSYPDAIAKFTWLPQLFSVLFFLMLFGIGSNVAMASCIITVIRDQFPSIKAWQGAVGISTAGFFLGLIYVTPGGQMILSLVDYFGATTIVYILAIGELVAISWIYGLDRFCMDLEFMLNRRPNWYWRLSWGVVTPGIMIIILIYALITLDPLTYKGQTYPDIAYAFGWLLAAFGILQLPIWAVIAIAKQDEKSIWDMIKSAYKPMRNWGPTERRYMDSYQEFIEHENRRSAHFNQKWTCRAKRWLIG